VRDSAYEERTVDRDRHVMPAQTSIRPQGPQIAMESPTVD
jgi:hypothetical protein